MIDNLLSRFFRSIYINIQPSWNKKAFFILFNTALSSAPQIPLCWILLEVSPEPVFLNVYGAQESFV